MSAADTVRSIEATVRYGINKDKSFAGTITSVHCVSADGGTRRYRCIAQAERLPKQPSSCTLTMGITATLDPATEGVLYEVDGAANPPRPSPSCRS